ncbi:dynein axonemal heavy chain 10-like isoform X4 [Scylla paramamosain]|uniref:dynein axonemal heavy chain 10-like isoform X4 n=1 Tax=Scylla paramamosain TaxID=85552 RepID=UPI0030839A6F
MFSSSEEEERTEEREAEDDEEEEEEDEEEEEQQDTRVWWVVRWVCQLLGYAPTTRPARLVWPKHSDHHYTPALVARFLDEAAKGKSLVFWQADYAEEDDDMDASPTDFSPPHPIASTAGENSFSWKFDKKDEDTEDEENEKPGNAKDVHKHTSTTKMAGPLLHVQETAAPPTIGVPVVLAKKACEGAVPEMEDKNQAQELMPLYIHLTYLLPHTHRALHAIFRQVYVPLCERLGKNDRTSYLANLARKFSRVSKLQPPSPALDYDSQEEDEGGQQGGGGGGFPKLMGRESVDGGPEERKEEAAGERKSEEEDQEDQEKDTRSPKTLLLNNTKRFKEKFSQVGSSNTTLGDLRSSWSNGFLELSSVLAHLCAHPLMTEQEMQEDEENEEGDKEELKEAVVQLADLHTGLADCYKSLEYLEKFIKVVGEGRLAGLEGLAGSLMEVLLLLWRLGRRQGISGRVQVMLECGVESLVGVVTRELRPVNLLPASMREAHPFLASQRRVMEALHVVAEWEEAVTVCAQTVMASAKRQRDGRQDFDPTKVLGTISGLRSVCTDLSDIMKVLLEAQVGFSGEWSALIRVQDPDQLRTITSQVLRVLTAYDFNIFSARNQDRWVRQKEDLQLAVQKWEQAVISAINESFQDRMTSELVTAVAGVLQKEPCRASFRQLLISRLPDLLSAFAEEVKGIRADFKAEQEKERPGTQAPLSGRVRWMSAYLTKRLAAWTTLKQLYSQHQGSSAGGDLWAEVEAEVEEVQGEVERAREQMVAQWGKRVTQQIPKLLVTPVLTRDEHHCGVGGWRVRLPGELQSVVWECGQLLQAGIRPPELATHLTLHYHTLQTAAMGLHLTLKDYHSVLDQLSPVQRELLSAELSGADRVLAAGQRVVTWSPAALTHFSTSCRDVIEHVRALANKLISITHHLDDHLTSIRETRLLNPTPRNTTTDTQHPPSLPELMGECKMRCNVMVEELVEVYERLVTTLGSAGLLLCSAEEGAPESLAAHIRTAPELKARLSPFLLHWCHNVQEAVTMMLVNSISSMEKLLQGQEVVFGVESSLTSTSTLTLTPPARTLTSILADALGHTVRSAMVFRHWVELEDGTVALNPAPTADDDTLATSTFYSQVSQDPRLHAAIESITSTFTCVIRTLDADLQSWYVYEHVWRRDKSATVNRFCRSGPSVKEYDDKLRFYTHLASELSQASQHKTHGCVSLDVRPLVGQVVRQAGEWVRLLGAGLLLEARNRLNHVLEQVTIINSELEQPTKDLASLTLVVRAVRQVTSQHAHLHTAILDVRQMFHTLSVYGIEVMDSDHRKLELTSERLEVLHQNSITVKRSLQPTQAFFLAKTQQKVFDFSKAVQRFQQKFESKGPGTVGEDLERGVVLLKEYSKKVDELQKEREQLDQEEDVFDLPATQYPGLDKAVVVMQQLREVFAIYQQLRSVEMTWRTMRWVTAKLDDLKGQVEGVRAALQGCDGGQETEVWRAMQQRLDDHTTSLEVTAALRQPAVQARHWQQLVTVAGCGGRWESSTGVGNVSVWDVLELRLSRHPLLVATTVDAAVRESHLNTQIKEIANFWQRTRLCVQTSTTVWTVEGLDELLDHLHNHNLILKAMANTRYCRPFAEEASQLAGTLVSVEALVEAWQDTQENVKLLLSHTLASEFSKAPELRARYRKLMERIERRAFVLELAGNAAFLEEVLVLQRYAQEVMGELGELLERPRCHCARLHFLTNQELMGLLAQSSPEHLNLLVGKLFNHVCGLRWSENSVKGLLTMEGEELHLLSPVVLSKDSGDGAGIGAGVQRLLDATHLTMKAAVQRVIEELGRERKLTRTMLQEAPLAAVAVAWRVWWAAGVDMALCATTKGERSALRRQLDKITEDITFLLGAMGRGQQRREEEELEQEEREVPQVPLSWVRTPSGRSCRSRRASVAALPSFRCLPLLLVTLHARDVVSSLIRSNACSVEDHRWVMQLRYSWQAQNSHLQLHAAYRSLDYGYEYSGCGSPDYVVTPLSERVLYATLAALAAHTPPLLTGESGGGRQSLMEAAAHIAGRFLLTFSLSPFTSVAALSSMLAGSLVGGSWLHLRECEQASPAVLSALASMLLNLNLAHTYTSANPVIQIGGHEVSLNPGAGVILGSAPSQHQDQDSNQEKEEEEVSQHSPLSHSLLGLSRPVHVAAPPAQTLVFVWLLAQGHPRAQEASEAVTEVLRQVLGSYRNLAGVVGLRLHLRLTQEVVRLLSLAYSPVQAAVEAFRSLVCPRLPLNSLDGVGRVLDHLVPPDSAVSSIPLMPTQQEESGRGQPSEEVLRRLGMRVISKQMKAVEQVAKELENWSCVVVVGPPRSGKTTTITAAVRIYQRRSGALSLSSTHQYTPSTAGYKSSRNIGKMRSWTQRTPPAGHRTVRSEESSSTHDSRHLSDRETITVDEVDESNIEVLSSGRRLVDRHVYSLRPQSYSQARLMGTETQGGLFSSLLQRLATKAIHSVVVLEGEEAGQCLLRLQDLPGTLLMDSLLALPPNPNLTFVVEVCSLEEVPGWVLGRAGVVQISPDMLSLATLLPEPTILPSTPTTDRRSDTSATPRTPSIPSTPATHPEEPPTSAALLDYLTYRLLHPLLQVLCASPSSVCCHATVDVIRLVESLRDHKSEEMTADCVAGTVQAVVQAGRCLAHPTVLSQVHHTLNMALGKVAGESVLDSAVLEVIENLRSSNNVSEQRWDAASSSWQPWANTSDVQSSSTASAVHASPTADTHRLAWLLHHVIPVGQPVMVAGYAGWGKTTITSMAQASLQDWVVVEVKVTPATTAEDVEAALLSHLTQTSHDTMTPTSPTIFCFDDVGGLERTSTTANYIQSVAQHQGMFPTSQKARWMSLAHVYMMCVCTMEASEGTEVEEGGGWWRGWAVYHMHHDQGAASSAALSAVLRPLAPLQSHAHTALTNATLLLAERVMPLLSPLEEPFIPASKTALVWQVVAMLRVIPLPSVSSASFLNVFNAWLHVLTSILMLPLLSSQVREDVWEELQGSIAESCSGLVSELPETPPVPLWHPGPPSPEEMPSYTTQQNAATKMAEILSEKNEVMEDEEAGARVASHGGVCLGVATVVSAVWDLLSAPSPPLLLCLGTATRDKQVVVTLAASYLGVELIKCDGEDSVLKLLEDPGAGGGAVDTGGDSGGNGGSDGGSGQSCSLTPALVHIPANVLHHPDVLKKLLDAVTKTGVGHSRVYVVTGCHAEVWPLSQELKWVTRRGRVVVNLPHHTTQHHQDFVLSLMKNDQYLQSEGLSEHFGIAEFAATVHELCCRMEEQSQHTRPGRRPPHSHHLPSVASLVHLVAIFSELLEKRKVKIHAKMEEVDRAVARVKELEDHVAGLRSTHATLEDSLSEANDNIQNMTTTLQQRGEDIVEIEGEASKLQEEVATVEAAWEELDKEVEEYVQETKAPLVEITEKVATLDIHRIRKLLEGSAGRDAEDSRNPKSPKVSRSPISAIQSVFECAVVLLGSADVSWRAVRHATQDDNFCVRLAAVCVPALTQAVISTLADKLEQVKMTVEHMSRVSDIGGVLLQYLRCVMFFWHRYHEDVQPRQARVQAINDQAKQLQSKLVFKEKRVKVLKEEVSSLKSRLREEERHVASLRSKRATVEGELETVLEVITHLSPHSERWREEAKQQTEMLQQVTGECLLAATCFTYLAALSPEAGEGLEDAWRRDLTGRGLLHPLPEDAHQEKFRLVSSVTEVEVLVREAVQFHSHHKSLLLVRDPHYLVEDYFESGTWLRTDGVSWLEELKEQLTVREQHCPVYLHQEHRAALETVPCILHLLKDVCKSNGNKMTMVVVVVVDDSCSTSPCPLCSRLTLLDLSLHYKGIVQVMAGTLLRWRSPDLQQRVQQAVDTVVGARRQKEKTEAQLVFSLTSAATVTASTELTGFMGHIKELNDVTGVLVQQEEEVKQLTEMVDCQYAQAACLAARLYALTSTLGTLHTSYNVPLSLVQDSISHRLASSSLDDASEQVSQEEILQVVTEAVFAVVETRLQQQHRLLVATCFGLARLNMFCEEEDFLKAFLIPLNLDETWLWGKVVPPKKEKKAEVDEEEKEGEEEDKEEQDMEEEKDEEEEKDKEEKEDKSEEEDPETKPCETVEEHQDQTDEVFPSWIPSECNVKSARILGKLSEGCCGLFSPSSDPLEECAASSLLQWLAGSASGWQQTFPAKTSLHQAGQWVVLARHLRQDQMLPAMTQLATLVLGAAALHAHPDPVSRGVGLLGRPHCTPARGLTSLIQVNVGHGGCAPRAVMEAGQKGGLPYYKVTFLSLATATKQEVRRRVVMAGRRRTWLVLLDAQAAPRNLAHARLALASLPATLPAPTVFCVVPSACHASVSASHSAVVVHVERPTSLASALAAYLPRALTPPRPPHHHQDAATTAAALTTAYVFSLLHARGERAASCWVHRPLLTETLLGEATLAARRQGTAPAGPASDRLIAWRDLAQFLAKVVVGSVVKTKLDQVVIDTIFSDHINGQVLRKQVRGPGEAPHSPVTPLPSPATPLHSGRREAEEEKSQESFASQPTHVLLHSLPAGDLMLDISRPPNKAIASVCGRVEAREATLLGIPEGRCLAEDSRKMTAILEDFTEAPWVAAPLWVAEGLLEELQGALGSPVGVVAQQVMREVTPETRAWQEEIKTWDAQQEAARRRLAALRQAQCASQFYSPLPLASVEYYYIISEQTCTLSLTVGSCK